MFVLCSLFAGCATQSNVPDIVSRTKGGEKWEDKVDYADPDNWFAAKDTGKAVDVIFFYPTLFGKTGATAPEISDIDDAGMREQVQTVADYQVSVFGEDCNIYIPFYRQVDAAYVLTLPSGDSEALMRYSASQDPARALDYYFEHFNNGKPFILAGHSQGSQILTMLLSDYMKEHPEYYKNMVAAYVIGYSVTDAFLQANPHLKFAEGANDTGVIISYNTEGPGNRGKWNAVVTPGAISINPINWKRDDSYAAASENKGSLVPGGILEGLADARVDPERGVVICQTMDPAVYAVPAPGDLLFGPESYHLHDYGFYYRNLQENIKVRIGAFIP